MHATATLRDDYLAALIAGDATRARWLIDEAVKAGLDVREVYLDVFTPVLAEIGDRWASGELTVAHEHHATAITQGIVGALAPRLRVPPATGRLAVVACTPGEQHALGAQMVADFLEAEGWEVLALGASTPAGDLAALVDDERPDVVALSTAMDGNLDSATDVVERLRALAEPPFVAAGGRAWVGASEARRTVAGVDAVFVSPPDLCGVINTRFPPIEDEE